MNEDTRLSFSGGNGEPEDECPCIETAIVGTEGEYLILRCIDCGKCHKEKIQWKEEKSIWDV